MKAITCQISNRGVRFSANSFVEWGATNLPKSGFAFSDHTPIFWRLTMDAYVDNTLHVTATDLTADPKDYQPTRAAKSPVDRLVFAPLPTEALLEQLSYYRRATLEPFLTPATAIPPPGPATAAAPDFSDYLTGSPLELGSADSDEPGIVIRTLRFTVPLTELTFRNGGVEGTHDLGALGEVTFFVPNDHLVAEFGLIKAFFATQLKRKTARIKGDLTRAVLTGDHRMQATSPEIDRIDASMIELFRVRSLKQLVGGEGLRSVDKSLFTPDGYFDSLDDPALGKATLPQDGRAMLDAILANTTVRNAKELTYLAGTLHGAEAPLRFVLTPKFGFVFTVAGQEATHYILELLNDHATYVWSIPRGWGSPTAELRSMTKELSTLGALGRQQYRRLLSFEHHFWWVVHEGSEAGVVDGFPRWRNRLLEGLV